ncbi:MAG TPA: hypothetical protein VIJ75_07645 [Hanamia sp.]
MKVSATVKNEFEKHQILVQTNDSAKKIEISAKECGFGSSNKWWRTFALIISNLLLQ